MADSASPPNSAAASQHNRVALCLSGGGYRAALFHLGALRRLNELGVLSRVTLVSSVSGGSVLAAHLATRVRPWPAAGEAYQRWSEVEASFRKIARTDVRTGPVLRRFLLPWNWFRPSTQAEALERNYERHLTRLSLAELPKHPEFIFCATDMIHGVLWKFGRSQTGSYVAGYRKPPAQWLLAKAVAASSCFPPVFGPLPLALPDKPKVSNGRDTKSRANWQDVSVSDGGLYDNLALEPSKYCGTVLVSDGGAPFCPTIPKGVFGRGKAYLAVMGRQAVSVRKRWLLSQLSKKERKGTYWGIASAVRKYRNDGREGYSKSLATTVIAKIRTDMDVFSDAEMAVLCNHGYLLADAAIEVHTSGLVCIDAKKCVPYPDWMDERKVEADLLGSSKTKWLGHGQ